MICKKCGRECEDDMPKCLWCDAPNDSKVNSSTANPADKIEPEETVHLTECEVRGDQAIYWLKAFFFTSLIMIILPITAIYWEPTNTPFDRVSRHNCIFLALVRSSTHSSTMPAVSLVIAHHLPSHFYFIHLSSYFHMQERLSLLSVASFFRNRTKSFLENAVFT